MTSTPHKHPSRIKERSNKPRRGEIEDNQLPNPRLLIDILAERRSVNTSVNGFWSISKILANVLTHFRNQGGEKKQPKHNTS